MDTKEDYAKKQKQFWNVDSLHDAMYHRVCTLQKQDESAEVTWKQDAEASLSHILCMCKERRIGRFWKLVAVWDASLTWFAPVSTISN